MNIINKLIKPKLSVEQANEARFNELVEIFKAAKRDTEEGILTMAKAVYDMVQIEKNAVDRLVKLFPMTSREIFMNLVHIGAGRMHVRLLSVSGTANTSVSALTYADQAAVFENGVQVVEKQQGGKLVTVTKHIHELSPAQVKMVFGNGFIRSVEEQINYINTIEVKSTVIPTRPAKNYSLDGDRIIVLSNTVLTMTDLEGILEEMKKNTIQALSGKGKRSAR